MVTMRCRRCGRISYKRGPCPTCRVYGEYGATDRVEIAAYGRHGELTRERDRWQKEALELRRLYASARHEEDVLREKVQRMERVRERLGRWARAIERARGELGQGAKGL